MEQSKHMQEILKLGKKIVEEFGRQETVDTLCRWMAHYISEKIFQIECEEDFNRKNELQKEVADLILKIWDRRKIQFDNLNPLRELKQALAILKILSKDQTELWDFQRNEFKKDLLAEFASKVNDAGFNIIKISLFLSLLPDNIIRTKIGAEEYDMLLSLEEKELIKRLNLYVEDFYKYKIVFIETNGNETNGTRNYLEKALNKIEELLAEQRKSFKILKESLHDK